MTERPLTEATGTNAPAGAPAADTFPKLLARNARIRGQRPAMREKDFGSWQTWTWAGAADVARALACGGASNW